VIQLCCVQDDANEVNGIVFKKTADDPFVIRETVQVIDAWQVNHLDGITTKDYSCTEEINGNAGPVADAGRGTG
jgi:hypothetical protein